MTNGGPEIQGTTPEQQAEINILQEEVNNQDASEIKQKILSVYQKAEELQRRLNSSREVKDEFGGTVDDKDTSKGKAVDVKRVVQKLLLASRNEDESKIPVPDGEDIQAFARSVIQKIGQHIDVQNVTELTAPNLYRLLHKTVTGDIADISSLAQEFKQIRILKEYSPILYNKLEEAMVEIAGERGLSEEQAKKLFGIKSEEEEQQIAHTESSFDQDRPMFDRYFDERHMPILRALYDPNDFNKLVELEKAEIREENPNFSNEEVDRETSRKLENKIIGVLSRPLLILDRSKPNETYDEIVKKDWQRGIETTLVRLQSLLSQLQSRVQSSEGLNNVTMSVKKEQLFYQMQENKATGQDGEEILQKLPVRKVDPFLENKLISLSEYVHFLSLNFETYIQTRKYLHNVNAIFQRPVGEKGFYELLAGYSGEISTLIMDELDYQPDAEIFRAALQLYDKYIEEDFASVNWVNQTDQARPGLRESQTKIQKEVIEQITIMFPVQAAENEDRIIAAVNMAMGASRGIYLTEPEKFAFADPSLTLKGGPEYTSYYTRDPDGLMALNPLHLILRFQSEGLMNPIFFLPMKGLDQGATWDHTRLLKKIQKYKDSFLKGREGADIPEKIFMDAMMNIGGVGGPIRRGGWRTWHEYNFLLKFVDEDFQSGNIDYLKTWKNVENIGYEVLVDFVGGIGGYKEDFPKEDFNGNLSDCPRKKALFEYVFEKYYGKEPSELQTYYSSILNKAEDNVHKKIKEGEIAPESLDEAIHLEASHIFLYRALSRVIAQRMPTKFICLERNRLSKDGQRAWEKIRLKFAEEYSDSNLDLDKNPIIFDKAMKDVMFAETIIRSEMSKEMKKVQEQKQDLSTAEYDYNLTEEKLETILSAKNIDSQRIERAKKLLKLIKQNYAGKDSFLDNYGENDIREKKYPFTFALGELDTSFLAFRSTGQNMLTRAINEINRVEQEVVKEVFGFARLLHMTSIDGKKDISKIVESMFKMKHCIESMHGKEPANRLSKSMASLVISYFKRDTKAKAAFGLFTSNKPHSLAAEFAGGRSGAVWEWEAREIDNFIVALESQDILSRFPYEKNKEPVRVPLWIKNPITGKMMKTPFTTRNKDFQTTSEGLRRGFGGGSKSIGFDMINKYVPILMAYILWKYISTALEEADEGKKK